MCGFRLPIPQLRFIELLEESSCQLMTNAYTYLCVRSFAYLKYCNLGVKDMV